jgi:hypothetical protein
MIISHKRMFLYFLLGGLRACIARKAGFPFAVASGLLFFCMLCVGFLCQPPPANKKICSPFSKLPLQSLPQCHYVNNSIN